jgi:hypothetical protein
MKTIKGAATGPLGHRMKVIKALGIKDKWGTWIQVEVKKSRFPTTKEALTKRCVWFKIPVK